ncbi:PAR12 polymerase, partial [Atractosteus spatula]|nr:PAR12 polymerase [Atractosteus spatula]
MSGLVLSNCATKALCRNQGCLEYRLLKGVICQSFNVGDRRLFDVLSDSSRFVIVQGREEKIPGCDLSPDSIIVAKTRLRLCKSYPECDTCEDLHLCRYFVCGHCRYGQGRNKCRNSHDIHSDHNGAILRAHFLQDLDEAELFQLLLQNDSYLLPEICLHYNKGSGPYGSCTFKERCTNLHVCQHYIQGDCKFGGNCKRFHSFDMNARNILSGRGLSAEQIHILPAIYKNKYRIDSSAQTPAKALGSWVQFQTWGTICVDFACSPCVHMRFHQVLEFPPTVQRQTVLVGKKERLRHVSTSSVNEVDRNEICLFFIRKHCSFKVVRNCQRLPARYRQLCHQCTHYIIYSIMPYQHSNTEQLLSCDIASLSSKTTRVIQNENSMTAQCLRTSNLAPVYSSYLTLLNNKCVRVHYHLPYKWEILDSDGTTWKNLPNMEEIEKAYCNPENSTSSQPTVKSLFSLSSCFLSPSPLSCHFRSVLSVSSSPCSLSVNFLTMTCGPAEVRRLSTASSVTKPPHVILTTEWVWYWKNEFGKWVEYGCSDKQVVSTVTSKTLENVYLAGTESNFPFSVGNHDYILFFKDMYQQNQKYKTKREVRRRPRLVSVQDVERKRFSLLMSFPFLFCLMQRGSSYTPNSTDVSIPSHWDKSALLDCEYKLIKLEKSVEEFTQVETLFRRTMARNVIHSIQRIQNPSLWKMFQWQKDKMMKRNGGNSVVERFLFHGTEKSFIEAICEQNFDWRVCGVHGSLYGKGSYFARDASYSHSYSKPTTSSRIMFVARVLVGDFTQGNSGYLRPPLKEGNSVFYDSCVNSTSNPSIFVIFEKHQIYPEYLIEYS